MRSAARERTQPNALLLGESASGKSTFVGALAHYLRRHTTKGTLRFRHGSRKECNERIKRRMIDERSYPEKTSDPYLAEVTVANERTFSLGPARKRLDVLDMAGERQDVILFEDYARTIEDIVEQEDSIIDEYETEILPTLYDGHPDVDVSSDDEVLSDYNRWKTIFEYGLLTSDRLIFLLNLHRLQLGREVAVSPAKLEHELVRQKKRVAVVVTSCDLIDYRPRTPRPGLLGGQFYDTRLYDAIKKKFTGDVVELMNYTKRRNDVDLFGVSVPPDEDDPNRLKRTDDGFEINGFETVVAWIQRS